MILFGGETQRYNDGINCVQILELSTCDVQVNHKAEPLPHNVTGGCCVTAGRFIHLMGEYMGDSYHYQFNIDANTWCVMAKPPHSLTLPTPATNTHSSSFTTFVIGDNIYLILLNGYIDRVHDRDISNHTYAYSISEKNWERRPHPETILSWGTTCSIGDTGFLVGSDIDTNKTLLFEYQEGWEEWKTRSSPILSLTDYYSMCEDGQMIYLFGGRNPVLQGYDPGTDKWTLLESAPKWKDSTSLIHHNKKLYAACGRRDGVDVSSETCVYDIDFDQWDVLDTGFIHTTKCCGTVASLPSWYFINE